MAQHSRQADLQQLQHRLADFMVLSALQQLVFQPDWLPQVGVGLAQDVVKLQGLFH